MAVLTQDNWACIKGQKIVIVETSYGSVDEFHAKGNIQSVIRSAKDNGWELQFTGSQDRTQFINQLDKTYQANKGRPCIRFGPQQSRKSVPDGGEESGFPRVVFAIKFELTRCRIC